ncbi:MAG: serine--tRNA ligase [Proteobacteria bacterium]|nr:serine--tRNA ligase [Pseudomonadota bacterium]
MLDPRTLATRRDDIERSCRDRGMRADVGAAVAAQEASARAQTALNEANQRRNEHQKVGKGKLAPDARAAHVEAGRRLKEEVAELEERARGAREVLDEALRQLPNFLHPEVPIGGEADYRVLKEVGKPPAFDFAPLDHLALGEKLDLLDFESAARVAGQKFYYLKNEAVLLELALQRFALDVVRERGFGLYTTPDLARPEILDGTGYNPRGEETQIYSIEGADLCLIGTAEITLGGLRADSILDEDELPLRVAGLSHCYRTEAGSHGRESRGLYRVHQFSKVEMFAFTTPEQSDAMHEELLEIEEQIFQALELPYRVIDVASGDLGAPAYRKFDIEAWMPGRGEAGDYGEVTSASNTTDFQARRLRIRYRRADSKKNELVHTLNGTAVAVPRAILALLENHQQADGRVRVPAALQSYLGRDVLGAR